MDQEGHRSRKPETGAITVVTTGASYGLKTEEHHTGMFQPAYSVAEYEVK